MQQIKHTGLYCVKKFDIDVYTKNSFAVLFFFTQLRIRNNVVWGFHFDGGLT